MKDKDCRSNGPRRAFVECMKTIAEQVKRVDDQKRLAPINIGSFAEAHDHAELVQWICAGAPDVAEYDQESSPECAQWQHAAHLNDEETHRLATIAEANAAHQNVLDATNGKGKGKCKGKTKGKGTEGKGKQVK